MVILISGSSHTGKTLLAQRLMEKYRMPYFSIDHLKMGLIRSKQTELTVYDDEKLTPYLWSIVKEIVKTAIENNQNLIVEGCYIPFDWEKDFDKNYLAQIKFFCLIMSENYIQNNFSDVLKFANVIENRKNDGITESALIKENKNNLIMCKKFGLNYILIDGEYNKDLSCFNLTEKN